VGRKTLTERHLRLFKEPLLADRTYTRYRTKPKVESQKSKVAKVEAQKQTKVETPKRKTKVETPKSGQKSQTKVARKVETPKSVKSRDTRKSRQKSRHPNKPQKSRHPRLAAGTPVSRRPLHSPGRAVFPHPVPRLYSQSRKTMPSNEHPTGRSHHYPGSLEKTTIHLSPEGILSETLPFTERARMEQGHPCLAQVEQGHPCLAGKELRHAHPCLLRHTENIGLIW